MPPSSRLTLRRPLLTALLLGVIALVFSGFYLQRVYEPTTLSPDGMDVVQATRRFARHKTLSTDVIRPLVLDYVRPYPDGSLPDLAHSPLFTVLSAIPMRLRSAYAAGQADQSVILTSLLFFSGCVSLCYLLSLKFFRNTRGALLSSLLFAFGSGSFILSYDPGPASCAALLFSLFLLAFPLSETSDTGEAGRIPAARDRLRPVLLGLFFSLALLTSFSLWAILPLALWAVYHIGNRKYSAVGVFLLTLIVIQLPFLIRTYSITHTFLPNARLLEITMLTERFPGYTLYRSATLTETLPQFLANGGFGQLLTKLMRGINSVYQSMPATVGLLPILFFGVSLFTRPAENTTRLLRNMIAAAILLHFVAVLLFIGPAEANKIWLIYLPFVCVVAANTLVLILQARNLPVFAQKTWQVGVIALLLLVSFVQSSTQNRNVSPAYRVYSEFLNAKSPVMQTVRQTRGKSLVCSESPWEVALKSSLPTVWMPNDAVDFAGVEQRMNGKISVIVLTPNLARIYGSDRGASAWVQTYLGLSSLLRLQTSLSFSTYQSLEKTLNQLYGQQINQQIAPVLRQAQLQSPVREPESPYSSLVFVDRTLISSARS